MACWFPSNTVESWFPQIRINRLAAEAAAVAETTTEVAEPVRVVKKKPTKLKASASVTAESPELAEPVTEHNE